MSQFLTWWLQCNCWDPFIPPAQASCWGIYWFHSDCSTIHPSILSIRPTCCFCYEMATIVGGFFPYEVQMITSMWECVTHNDLWPGPLSSRSFSHDFAIKLLRYFFRILSCSLYSHTVLVGFLPYLAQMITRIRWCVVCKDLDLYLQGYSAMFLQ